MTLEAPGWVPGRWAGKGCKGVETSSVSYFWHQEKMPRNACTKYRRDPCSGKSYTTQTVGGIGISAVTTAVGRRGGTESETGRSAGTL